MTDKLLTASFWLSEFTASQTAVRKGLDNTPPQKEMEAIIAVLAPGMQRIRSVLGTPVLVSSGYRSPELNRLIGGATNSAHTKGLAADFTSPNFGTPAQIVSRLIERQHFVQFDQVILEFGRWVHVAFAPLGERPSLAVLTARRRTDGSTAYERGLA